MRKKGAFPDHRIADFIDNNLISYAVKKNIRPASIDLALSEEIYRVDGIVQPKSHEIVRGVLPELDPKLFRFDSPLECNVTYLARLEETFNLATQVYGHTNPKSSSGRTDLHVRVIADGVPQFDSLPGGMSREAWLVIIPKSFPVILTPGTTLAQARFFSGDTRFDDTDLEIAMKKDGLLWHKDGRPIFYEDLEVSDRDGSIILTIDLSPSIPGWECLGSSRVLDFAKKKSYRPDDFFRPLQRENGKVRLRRSGFYIFYTKERVRVPLHLACEMLPMHERQGEFRSHKAGFVDPGWGCGKDGEGKGRRLVLEISPFEDIVFRDGQPVARIQFERLTDLPEFSYDDLDVSNYKEEPENPQLGKQFLQV